MKNIKLSLITLMALGTFAYAGGDLNVVTPYEVEDVQLAEEAYVEPYVEPYVAPAPEPEPYVEPYVAPPAPEPEPAPYIAPAPIISQPVVVPPVVPLKHIKANGFYAGLGIAASRYKASCSCPGKSGTDKTAGVMARAGYDFNRNIGIEARGLKTNWKSDGGKVEHAGLFVKPMLPVSDTTNVYGLVGVAKTKTKGRLRTTDASGLALGVGIEVDLSADTPKAGRYNRSFDGHGDQEKGLGMFADYERMLVKSGAPQLDAVSAGVTYDF